MANIIVIADAEKLMSRLIFLFILYMNGELKKSKEELFQQEVEQLELRELSSVLGGYEGSGGDCKNENCTDAGNACSNGQC